MSGAGSWRVRREDYGEPYYSAVLHGSCRLAVDGHEPVTLQAGDFVLIPSAEGFSISSLAAPRSERAGAPPVALPDGEYRIGTPDGPPDVQLLVGYCVFRSPDAALLVSLLPRVLHIRGQRRLATLAQLVAEEYRGQRPAREVVLARLLEVLLIEALRASTEPAASPGLLRGLADERLAAAIRRMHERPARPWTVAQLAREAALSRSSFFDRFKSAVGVAPMEYLLAWRIALAKTLLQGKTLTIAEVAERVGYSSASTFSVAFARFVGLPPKRYARERPISPPPADRAPAHPP